MFSKLFKELDIPLVAQRIFADLIEKGPSTARQLSERLDIPRPSIYDNTKILIQKGLVTEKTAERKKVFCIDDINNIPELVQAKIELLKTEKKHFEDLLPSLSEKIQHVEPKIKFYSGSEGLKQVMNHIMLHRDIETILMWPMSEMARVLGTEYLTDLNRQRIKRRISIRGIWPQDKMLDFKGYPFLGVGKDHLRDLRLAPKEMTWNMGYWMYEDKVVFLSSQKEMFGFVVHSKDFTDFLRTQFEAIWKISSPVKPQPEYTDRFLEDIGEKERKQK